MARLKAVVRGKILAHRESQSDETPEAPQPDTKEDVNGVNGMAHGARLSNMLRLTTFPVSCRDLIASARSASDGDAVMGMPVPARA